VLSLYRLPVGLADAENNLFSSGFHKIWIGIVKGIGRSHKNGYVVVKSCKT
jgi:hypothetical protein